MESKILGRVRENLVQNGSITADGARKNCGTSRLSHYIYLLRRDGHIIKTVFIKAKNQFGEACKYAKYVYINTETSL